tara:strand:+ start:711 stop:1844 length:1134 start_codon:yes stop_codon:yes gene_type:complete
MKYQGSGGLRKSDSVIAREKQESQLKTSNMIGAANLYINAKTLRSLNQLNQTQQELVSINQQLLSITQNVLNELTRQTNILERQEVERKAEKYKLDVQNQLKDVVFNVNQDIEKILNNSTSLAESYFRSRSIIFALNSYDITSNSFSEINDKVFWSNLEEKLNAITEEAINSDDDLLKGFIVAVDKLYQIENFDNDNSSDTSKIKSLEDEIEAINKFLEVFKDAPSMRKNMNDFYNNEIPLSLREIILRFRKTLGPMSWDQFRTSSSPGSSQLRKICAGVILVLGVWCLFVEVFIIGIVLLGFSVFVGMFTNNSIIPDVWEMEIKILLKSLQEELELVKDKSSKAEFDLLEHNRELEKATKEVAAYSKHYKFLTEVF